MNPESFISGCMKGFAGRAINDYGRMIGVTPDNISAEIKAKLAKSVEPLENSCACMARKISTKVESDTTTTAGRKIELKVDLSGFENSADCAPDPATSATVQRNFIRLVEASPPATSLLKTKRSQFSVEVSMTTARPSLFAAYTSPPENLTRLVFLAPGTGSACATQNLCVEKSPLEITTASKLLISHGRVLGKEGAQILNKVIDEFGEDTRIITSSSNFANFVPAQQKGGLVYPVQFIDGVPVEKTIEKKVWLVLFASQIPAYPRAMNFSPAIASVLEVEFLD